MTIRILAAIGLASCALLPAADEPTQKPQSSTQRMDFPSGGTLRLTKSTGLLTVEAWDRPDVEITAIKQSDKVRVAAERHGDELVVTTDFPRRRAHSEFVSPQNDNVPFEQSRNVLLTPPSWGNARRTTTHDAG